MVPDPNVTEFDTVYHCGAPKVTAVELGSRMGKDILLFAGDAVPIRAATTIRELATIPWGWVRVVDSRFQRFWHGIPCSAQNAAYNCEAKTHTTQSSSAAMIVVGFTMLLLVSGKGGSLCQHS
jgi:hypothetical protein